MALEGTPHMLAATIERVDDRCVVQCRGDLAGPGCSVLQEKVMEALPGSKAIVLDLTELEFIDSMGLGTLVRLHRKCKETGCRLELSNMSSRIRQLLTLTNLLSVIA